MSVTDCFIHNGSPMISILNQINPISHIDTYFFTFYSNTVLSKSSLPTSLSPLDLQFKIFLKFSCILPL